MIQNNFVASATRLDILLGTFMKKRHIICYNHGTASSFIAGIKIIS